MPLDQITFQPQPDGSVIKTTVQVIPKNGVEFEAIRLKELTADLERRLSPDQVEQQEIAAAIVAYKTEQAKLPPPKVVADAGTDAGAVVIP